ncbi:poly A binding protein [Capsaspora owczarzaki ATCC 30864]|uniref:Polyadenylate-binding protein n=1 Tax=Capsaspora owczarzaki (strain ATCC 30864) TaxID=595528 RepID=A0A0D2WM38_CAPO3|nr:poly A binding protein [Capsaspora owczarzaki ATCC 30864]KJE91118.1 poly A binding protein [Capsaspora owczarzaki ATCC 30864]|eukprot:XP_004349052.1 poly A binding protein [Capsaspora owczarzaki ATCC 30864]
MSNTTIAAQPAAAPAAAAGAAPAAANTTTVVANAAAGAAPSFPSGSLYVGDLHPEVTEAQLFEIFNNIGPVVSIRVCRDAITRRSLGYAYVNFHAAVDAERALDTLNYSLIRGKPCRIMWSQRDPAVRKSGLGNVFIKNLDKTIDNKALLDTFSAFGNILSCKVVTDENGSKGYGFVHYETQEAAETAIAKVNGMVINGKQVFVGIFVPRKERVELGEGVTKFTNVFVKNLPEDTTDAALNDMFSKFGKITSVVIMKSSDDDKSKGFGFVCYEKVEDAQAAVNALNGTELAGKTLFVARAQKKAEREAELKQRYDALRLERINKYQGINLYVKNLDDAIDEDKIRTEFAPFGTITSVKIMRDEKGKSRGFGFICFSSAEEATKAVTEMNGQTIQGFPKPLYVALAQRAEDRRAQLAAHFAQQRGNMGGRMAGGVIAGMPPQYMAGPQMFYAGVPQNRGMVYPQNVMRRGAWPANVPVGVAAGARPGFGPFMAVPQGVPRQAGNNSRGGNRAPRAGAPGMINQQFPQQQQPQQPQQPQQQQSLRAGQAASGAPRQQGAQQGAGARQAIPKTAGRQGASATAPAPSDERLANLSQFDLATQKRVLGETLFPLIAATQADLAGKITGMLLEMDNTELLHLISVPDALAEKVQEAVTVLQTHGAQN